MTSQIEVVTSTANAIERLLNGETVEYVYNDHYGVYLLLRPNGHATITDGDRPDREWYVRRSQIRSAIDETIQDIYIVLAKTRRAQELLPFGNFEDYGGVTGVAKIFMEELHLSRHVARAASWKDEERWMCRVRYQLVRMWRFFWRRK